MEAQGTSERVTESIGLVQTKFCIFQPYCNEVLTLASRLLRFNWKLVVNLIFLH